MTEYEKKAIVRAREHLTNPASNYLSDEEIETLLNLIDEQQRIMKNQEKIIMEQEKEIDKYKKQEFGNLFNGRYISKDKIRKLVNEYMKSPLVNGPYVIKKLKELSVE